jgi:segregation and condensation protein B
METLAVVAFRQPVLRAEVEAIRGVNCGEILRQLMDRDLVRIGGRSEELGRPYLYATTKNFLRVFGLDSLDCLPRAAVMGRTREVPQVPSEDSSVTRNSIGEPDFGSKPNEEDASMPVLTLPELEWGTPEDAVAEGELLEPQLASTSDDEDEDYDEYFDEEDEDYDEEEEGYDEEEDEDFDEDEYDEEEEEEEEEPEDEELEDEWQEVEDEDEDWDDEDEDSDWGYEDEEDEDEDEDEWD